MSLLSYMRCPLVSNPNILPSRYVHASTVLNKTQAGRYRPKGKKCQSLSYEMANPPHYIGVRKSWNSWNTSNVKDGNRPAETLIEDLFIRNFMTGTWHYLFANEIIIKRQHNLVRICCIVARKIIPYKIYFLTGYSETLLSYWLHCPVKIELVTVESKKSVTYKTI